MFVNSEERKKELSIKSLIFDVNNIFVVDAISDNIKMASKFISDDFEVSEELPRDAGFILEVYETNYHFEKRFAVHGYNTVGELILFIVQEIGESLFFLFSFFLSFSFSIAL